MSERLESYPAPLLGELTDIMERGLDEQELSEAIIAAVRSDGYTIVEIPVKPWGMTMRMDPGDAGRFSDDFFPSQAADMHRMIESGLELSPKFMLWRPGSKISWQYHDRRAEIWRFLTSGAYMESQDDEMSEPVAAFPGDIVKFDVGTRHRGAAPADNYTLVAEVWQHTDPEHPSDEDDITRLLDEFARI